MGQVTYPDWCEFSANDPTEAMLHIDRSLKYLVQVMAEIDQVQRKQLRALNTLRTAANLWVLLLVGGIVLTCIFGGGLFSAMSGVFY